MFTATLFETAFNWLRDQWWFVLIFFVFALFAAFAGLKKNVKVLFPNREARKFPNPFETARLSSPDEYTRDGHVVKLRLMYSDRSLEIVEVSSSSKTDGILAEYAWLNSRHPDFSFSKQVLLRVLEDGSLKPVASMQWDESLPEYPAEMINFESTQWLDLLKASDGGRTKWFLFDVSSFLEPMGQGPPNSEIFERVRNLVSETSSE